MQRGSIYASRPFAQEIANVYYEDVLDCWDAKPLLIMKHLETMLARLLEKNGQSPEVRVCSSSCLATVFGKVWRIMQQL